MSTSLPASDRCPSTLEHAASRKARRRLAGPRTRRRSQDPPQSGELASGRLEILGSAPGGRNSAPSREIRGMNLSFALGPSPVAHLFLHLTPLECADPRKRLLTPLESALPKTKDLKSFRIRTYEKSWGRG